MELKQSSAVSYAPVGAVCRGVVSARGRFWADPEGGLVLDQKGVVLHNRAEALARNGEAVSPSAVRIDDRREDRGDLHPIQRHDLQRAIAAWRHLDGRLVRARVQEHIV